MKLAIYESTNPKESSQMRLVLTDTEMRHICKGFVGGTPKLQIRGQIGTGLTVRIADRGYATGANPQKLGKDVAAWTRLSCAVFGARQSPSLSNTVYDPEYTEEDGQPILRLPPLPDLSEDRPFNPALPARAPKFVPRQAPPPAPAESAPPPVSRREHVLAVVARHSSRDPEYNFAPPSNTAAVATAPGPWAGRDRVEYRSIPTRPGGSASIALAEERAPVADAVAVPAEVPEPPPKAPAATSNDREELKAAIELVNDIIARRGATLGIAVKNGRLAGYVKEAL